jgi:hypothetical protein
MDHHEAVRQKATERYLLDDLDAEERDQFEEHLFDCQDCALDVRAGAMFVDQTKVVLAEAHVVSRVPDAVPSKPAWLAWFRPAFAIPVLALLLAVIGYQNFVLYPHLMQAANEPQVGPWASVNVSTRGSAKTEIKVHPGEGFGLLVNLPPDNGFASAASAGENRQIYVPGRDRRPGTYALVVRGITASGESQEISRHPIDVQIQK